MKKSLVLAVILSVAMLGLGISAYADDHSVQISALEQQAERIQNQIKQTQAQCGVALNGQLKPLSDSVESLVKQRVQLGAQIQQMEGQIQELKQSALSTCSRQVKQQEEELAGVKQQIANHVAKGKAEAAQQANEAAKQPASAAPAPAPAAAAPATVTPAAPGFRKVVP
jgi:peptidoglycan hydrolase CwlO-like protein